MSAGWCRCMRSPVAGPAPPARSSRWRRWSRATGLSVNSGASLQMESRAIVELCARPKSLAEVGAALQVPVGVARVLVGDLANGGYLEVHLPRTADGDGGPGHEILGRLLDGLRSR